MTTTNKPVNSRPDLQDYSPADVLRRAINLFCRNANYPCPSHHLSVDSDARQVILANVNGELARYRISKDGSLRIIKEAIS